VPRTTEPFSACFGDSAVFARRPACAQRPPERTVSRSLVVIQPMAVTKLMSENHTPLPDMPVCLRFLVGAGAGAPADSATAQAAAKASRSRHATSAARIHRRHVVTMLSAAAAAAAVQRWQASACVAPARRASPIFVSALARSNSAPSSHRSTFFALSAAAGRESVLGGKRQRRSNRRAGSLVPGRPLFSRSNRDGAACRRGRLSFPPRRARST
jgi:hypothetical protein